jgi:hypothetical protein
MVPEGSPALDFELAALLDCDCEDGAATIGELDGVCDCDPVFEFEAATAGFVCVPEEDTTAAFDRLLDEETTPALLCVPDVDPEEEAATAGLVCVPDGDPTPGFVEVPETETATAADFEGDIDDEPVKDEPGEGAGPVGARIKE